MTTSKLWEQVTLYALDEIDVLVRKMRLATAANDQAAVRALGREMAALAAEKVVGLRPVTSYVLPTEPDTTA